MYWQDKLKEKYPLTLSNLICFECDEGWCQLLDSLCLVIENTIKNSKLEETYATQVKEKFGTLRFYMSGGNDFIDGAIDMAETHSAHICEICGKSGSLEKNRGWWKTLCEEHRASLSK